MMQHTDLRRLLVLHGPDFEAQGILPLLREHYDVKVVGDVDEALDEMRSEPFSGVLAETADFLPLERGVVSQQAAVVLDSIGDGVCIVGGKGELVWVNRRLRTCPSALLNSIREICTEAYEQFATSPDPRDPDAGKRFSLMPGDGTYYEVLCSPVRDRQGLLRQVAAVVVNATSQRRQQRKINAIERAGRELVRLDKDLLRDRDAFERLQLLEERIIRCSKDVLNYEHFAVLLHDKRTNRLDIIISVDLMDSAKSHQMFANPEGSGICGYVAATGNSYVCQDVRNDRRYLPGLSEARSSLTVPLRLHDRVIGVLNAESRRLGAFSEEDRQFAEIFANYVALALHILDLLSFERYSTQTRLTGSVCSEMAGPLNDILTEAGNLQEDYLGLDDLRKGLAKIIEAADEARKRMQCLSDGARSGVITASKDGVETEPLLEGKRVLIADDEDLIRQTVGDVLLPHGCDVDRAGDGSEACRMVKEGGYDLVISDIRMPGATGYEVFSAAKEADPDVPVILITGFGYDPDHSIVRANQEGLASVIMKPFKVKELLEHCREALLDKE
ncbi:MAG: response regulator [Planctomycetota bacterium]